jgi:hypothetical protein
MGFRLIPRLLCARPHAHNTFRREIALSYLITVAALALSFALIIYTQDQGNISAFDSALILYIYAYAFNPGLKIWNKLRKMGDEQNELPPGQRTAS